MPSPGAAPEVLPEVLDVWRPRLWRRSLLLFLLCLAVYNGNLRYIASYDSLATSLVPSGLWRGDGIHLDRYAQNVPPELRYSFYRSSRGHWIPLYPIVTPLLVTPLYVPTAFLPQLRPDDKTYGHRVRVLLEKISASIVAALSVLFVFWTLRRKTTERAALGLSLLYAFGTSTWVISSQALWQHGPAELFLAVSLYLLLDPEPRGSRAFLLGATAGLLTANRPQDLLFSLALAWIVARRSGKKAWPFLVASGTLAILLLAYNRWYFPTILGGYVEFRTRQGTPLPTHLPALPELAGLLVSNRGLLVFCPFLLALFWLRPRPGREREETAVLGAAWFLNVLFHTCFSTWTAGSCYGPRYLTDGLPLLFVLLAAVWNRLGRPGRALFAIAALYSVALQAIGAFCYPGGDSGSDQRGLWDIAHAAPVLALHAGLESPDFIALVARPLMTGQLATPEDFAAKIAWAEPPPADWPADGVRDVRLHLENHSHRFWSSFGGWFAQDSVRWVFRWKPDVPFKRPLIPEEKRHLGDNTWITWRLEPGAALEETLTLVAPPWPGMYTLTIEPGQLEPDRYHLFSELGTLPAIARVRVVVGGARP